VEEADSFAVAEEEEVGSFVVAVEGEAVGSFAVAEEGEAGSFVVVGVVVEVD